MIGFEGSRFIRILDDLDPQSDRVFPILGVPGFRPNYPFLALEGNRIPLEKTEGWVRMYYARANCPFSAFYCIQEIRERESMGPVVLAPIGTKPHALGAILYCIESERCSIAYDHPIRKAQRTQGISRVCEYHVSAFRDMLKTNQN
jgi:hypothetical protein